MRIAIFTDTYLPEINGVVTSLESHSRLLAARGHDLLIICPKYRRHPLTAVPRVQVKRYQSFSFVTNKDTRVALPSIASVAATLRRFRPDIVHVHTPLSIGVVGLATARMLRLPTVQTYHTYLPDFMQYVELHRLLRLDDLQDRVVNSLIFERMFESGTWRRLAKSGVTRAQALAYVSEVARTVVGGLRPGERPEFSTRVAWQYTRTLYNRSDLVLTPSMRLQRELQDHGVTVPVEHLSNGIDMSIVRPKGDWKLRQRLVHAGRLGHEKNVDVVVHAFAHLLERHPGVRLDIIGDGPAREGLERLVARLGIQDRVGLLGFMNRTALGRAYAGYDAFVTASTIETQGIVLLEAMSAGLPVVGVDALAIPELVADGRNGFVVPPGDEEAMAEALERLLGDEALRERLGTACREDVKEHALESVVTRLESHYERVLAARREADGA
ncbi:MAG TPA: glycosyltransferase [Coriobacteriia bacterium]|nr:glycosyltransferase [Coriobacteriia bacterium]